MPPNQKNQVIYRSAGFNDFPPLQTASLAQFLFNSPHAKLDDYPAFIDAPSGLTITRGALYDLCLRLAKGVDTLGLRRGTGVAMVFSPNSLAWPIVFFGLVSNGVCTTLANPSYTPPELAHQIRDSRAHLIFVHPTLLSVLTAAFRLLDINEEEMRKRIVIMSYVAADVEEEKVHRIDPGWMRLDQLLQRGKIDAPVRLSESETDETILMCYSSGTTGPSKGVETTHRNLASLLQQYHPVSFPYDPATEKEICFLPLSHIFGIAMVLCFAFWSGVTNVILPKYDAITFFKAIERYRVTILPLAPPVLVALASHPGVEQYDLRSVRYMLSGGAPLGEGLMRRVITRFQKVYNTRVTVVQGYGLTETSPATHMVPFKDSMRKLGSVGALLPCVEARLVDDNENDVEPGEGIPGEIWLRAPQLMKGYLNNPTATTNSITKDGWFKTGDIATRDNDGFYYIVDRKKELIKYKGFQVPPADLEAVLLTNDHILDAAVIGVENKEQATELPRAYVVPKNPALLTANSTTHQAFERYVQEWIKPRVAKHKYLRGGVKVVEAIPKTGSGKILRRQLRDRAAREKHEESVEPVQINVLPEPERELVMAKL